MLFEDWGLIDYEEALQKQIEWVQKRHHVLQSNPNNTDDFLIFCSHPAVVTTGRQTLPEDIFSWNGKIIEISRGGRATYHGPSQLVVYPILNLKNSRKNRGPQEVRGYLRALEQAIVLTLKDFNIEAVGKTPQKIPGEKVESDETGVWIGNKKIASLGIAVKNWITYHGAAININYDPLAFQGMNPCGFNSSTMISIEQILNAPIDKDKFKSVFKKYCFELL